MASSNRSAGSLPARLMLLLVLAVACLQASASVAANSPTAASATRALQEAASAAQATSREWADKLDKSYLSNADLGLWMHEYEKRCAPLARRFSIGSSAVDKAPLWVLEISDNPGVQEPEPNFKYVANMHGDETSGRALLPLLAEWLCDQYQKDERATRIVRDMHLFILPTMNPDGFARGQRNNGQNVDLNRDFPDPQYSCQPSLAGCLPSSLLRTMNQSAPEAQTVMRWSLPANARRLLRRSASSTSSSSSVPTPPRNVRSFHFTAAANLHEGAVVANYPFDGAPLRRNLAAVAAAAAAAEPVTAITQGAMAAVTAESARQQQQQRPSDIGQALEQAPSSGGSIPRTSVTPPAALEAASDGSSSSSEVGSSSVVLPAGYHGSPDDQTFRFLASTYAKKHTWMSDPSQNGEFAGGITNGAAWYDIYVSTTVLHAVLYSARALVVSVDDMFTAAALLIGTQHCSCPVLVRAKYTCGGSSNVGSCSSCWLPKVPCSLMHEHNSEQPLMPTCCCCCCLQGGMQDWDYLAASCMDITLPSDNTDAFCLCCCCCCCCMFCL
jgi:hypothetical protein